MIALSWPLAPEFDPPLLTPSPLRKWLYIVGHETLQWIDASEEPDAAALARLGKFRPDCGARAFVLDGLYDGEKMARALKEGRDRDHLYGEMYMGRIDDVLRGARTIVAVEWRELKPN